MDWQLNIYLTLNDFVKAIVGSHLKYHHNIKFKKDVDGDDTSEA